MSHALSPDEHGRSAKVKAELPAANLVLQDGIYAYNEGEPPFELLTHSSDQRLTSSK